MRASRTLVVHGLVVAFRRRKGLTPNVFMKSDALTERRPRRGGPRRRLFAAVRPTVLKGRKILLNYILGVGEDPAII